ncbi:MAG: hypothetical protein HY075_08765 [Deltaproteobacteria bacterium]|nr:hypothetical protein [Deltaproteobacteria bacterium]
MMKHWLALLFLALGLALGAAAYANECDEFAKLVDREAEQTALREKYQNTPGKIGKRVKDQLEAERKKVTDLLATIEKPGYDAKAVADEIAAMKARSKALNSSLEALGPANDRLAKLAAKRTSLSGGAAARLDAETAALEKMFEENLTTGKYNTGGLARLEQRLHALEDVAAQAKPVAYENPGGHVPGNPQYQGGSPLPADADALFKKAIPEEPGKWWAFDGQYWHRFEGGPRNGQTFVHWNGSSDASVKPKLAIDPNLVPKWIREAFGQT